MWQLTTEQKEEHNLNVLKYWDYTVTKTYRTRRFGGEYW